MSTELQQERQFEHALKFRDELCIGCSHCMRTCPTEAIRVVNGKAFLHPNRCIDCGKCYMVCPVGAITVDQDDFESIFNYKYRVALIPAVLTGQFPEYVEPGKIISSIRKLGFTHVHEVEEGTAFLIHHFNEFILNHQDIKPLISPFCPAVVRLIQVKFPTLTRHLLPLKAPVDITAMHVRKNLLWQGAKPDEIGIFYVTPCAAKIVAVKSPVGEEKSVINGVINLNYLYNKVFKMIRQTRNSNESCTVSKLSSQSICWSLTNGEADQMQHGRSLAIDEIGNVIEILEKIENEEIDGVDFLELRACDESCAGGILCPSNRFITADQLKKRGKTSCVSPIESCGDLSEEISITDPYLISNMHLDSVRPRSIMKLDNNLQDAMIKMKRIYEVNQILPQVDCGICGSPTCKSLSEDIVLHQASLQQCIFIQKILEQLDHLDIKESVRIMKSIWSDNKLDQNSLKNETMASLSFKPIV